MVEFDLPIPIEFGERSLEYGANRLVLRMLIPTDSGENPALDTLPLTSRLGPAAPNPFRGTTSLAFELARAGRVDLAVFDVAGRRVASVLPTQVRAGGRHAVAWSGRGDNGSRVPPGVYFVHLSLDGARAGDARKLVILPR